MKRNIFIGFLLAGLGALAGIGAYTLFAPQPQMSISEKQKVQFASLPTYASATDGTLDFTVAAAKTVPGVVHIKVTADNNTQSNYNDPFRDFFGDSFPFGQRGPSMGSGSGVIISADGYIVTNNHVVRNASKIEVTLNDKRTFKGKLIGADPNTDLALIKIDASNLNFVVYGNSDDTKIGEWVLAVGNPFNLTSTVTAGIISAKGRNINIIGENGNSTFPIESFIQTDAAVNPGNSGGALVNTKGELIGINTAIASQTGSYAGYSFAVPVNLVKKVMDDIMEFGKVQRAFLGVQIQEVNSEVAKEKGLNSTKGVFVARVNDGGAAKDAGIEEGDVVLSIAGVTVNSSSELMEQVGRHRPGDKIDVKVLRGSKEKSIAVVLRGEDNTTAFSKKEKVNTNNLLGADFQELEASDKKSLKIENGIKVSSLRAGKLSSIGIRTGFIITKLNNQAVNKLEDIDNVISNAEGNMLMVEGVYPQNPYSKYVYSFNIK
jgi:Do/DeqQ family serine protease